MEWPELARAVERMTDEERKELKERAARAVRHARQLQADGAELSAYQKVLLEAAKQLFPEPDLRPKATIILDCPKCGVTSCHLVVKTEDSIVQCRSCEAQLRIRKDKFDEKSAR